MSGKNFFIANNFSLDVRSLSFLIARHGVNNNEHARTITNRHEQERTLMAAKCLPLPEALRITWGELEAMPPDQQRAFWRALLEHWEANDQYQRQLENQADKHEQELWW